MKAFFAGAILLFFCVPGNSQQLSRPKLVVGIVVDQMRWDNLYRYYDRYGSSGFKRLISGGFSCDNTMIPYGPTITACGHSSIFTGSVPAITGIAGNNWYDYVKKKNVYCTEDPSVQTVGSSTTAGQQSPDNLLTTTITDELRLATNFRSKVIGIAMKDRGSVLPAGHSANAAYWYDNKAGEWITSTYYLKDLPTWVTSFHTRSRIDSFYNSGWATMYPAASYVQSTPDLNEYELKPFGPDAKGFPYNFKKFAGTNYNAVLATPFGNSLTEQFAKRAITAEQLGEDDITDFLTVSFSSTDYVGHTFGPNSVESEDTYLRLDKDLSDFFSFLDDKVGKGAWTVFLTADHGAANVPSFVMDHHIPSGAIEFGKLLTSINDRLKTKFSKDNLALDISNYQVSLNLPQIDSAGLNIENIKSEVIKFLSSQPGIYRAFDLEKINTVTLNPKIREMLVNGYFPSRSGQVQLILDPQWIEGFGNGGTTHGLWNPYDAHIPLLWYGWGIRSGKLNREVYMTDIAATVAALLHIQMPSGCVGKVIEEVQQ